MRMRSTAAAAATMVTLAALGVGGSAQAAEAESAPLTPVAQAAPGGADAEAAQGGAYNRRTLTLRFPSSPGAESCTFRTIYLAADWYRWEGVNSGAANPLREVYLAAGDYRWVDCIHHSENNTLPDGYRHQSALQQVSTGGAVRLDDTRIDRHEIGFHLQTYGSKLTQL